MNKVIEIKDLSYTYPDGNVALKNITLDVLEGESLGIIGPNGAGKSTFLLHLNGVLKGTSTSKILNYELIEKNMAKVRSKVGLVFQDPDDQLFMPTVLEDVAFGPVNSGLSKSETDTAVANALKQVDMTGSEKRSAHHMSFGEKKRVSIATVLSMDPKILVLDEPSSNLDPKHRRELIEFLISLKHTKVIATHDLDLVAKCCSRVVIFDRGGIVAADSTEKIIHDRSLLEKHGLA